MCVTVLKCMVNIVDVIILYKSYFNQKNEASRKYGQKVQQPIGHRLLDKLIFYTYSDKGCILKWKIMLIVLL